MASTASCSSGNEDEKLEIKFQSLTIDTHTGTKSIKKSGVEYQQVQCDQLKLIILKSNDYRNGFMNATKLCEAGKRTLNEWLKLEDTEQKVEDFTNFLNPPKGVTISCEITDDESVSGTYFHPDLLVLIASWLSNEFAFKVLKIIKYLSEEQTRNELKLLNVAKLERLDKQLQERDSTIESLQEEVQNKNIEITNLNLQAAALEGDLEARNTEIATLRPLASPYLQNLQKINSLVIFDKNDRTQFFPYYAVRGQEKWVREVMRKHREQYPHLNEFYIKHRDPNSLKLFNLIKEQIAVQFHGNHFKCTSLTREQLINEIDQLYQRILYPNMPNNRNN